MALAVGEHRDQVCVDAFIEFQDKFYIVEFAPQSVTIYWRWLATISLLIVNQKSVARRAMHGVSSVVRGVSLENFLKENPNLWEPKGKVNATR